MKLVRNLMVLFLVVGLGSGLVALSAGNAKAKQAPKEAGHKAKVGGEPKEVKQPGVELYWLRCPIGQRWSGSSCEGEARWMNWYEAANACPIGYRLPTQQEFMSLLGGCGALVGGGGYGSCNMCASSTKCSSMFGEDRRWYWSTSSYAADPLYAWHVNFDNGHVYNDDKGPGKYVRCARSGTPPDSGGTPPESGDESCSTTITEGNSGAWALLLLVFSFLHWRRHRYSLSRCHPHLAGVPDSPNQL